MPDEFASEEQIRLRVEKHLNRVNEFYIHLAVYIGVNLLLWLIFFFAREVPAELESAPFPWPLIVMGGWGVGLLSRGLNIYFNSPSRLEQRERTVQREIEREHERLQDREYANQKLKRDVYYTLSDDGELVEVDDSLQDAPSREHNHRQ